MKTVTRWSPHNPSRECWKQAWRLCRKLEWGTLHFSFNSAICDAARAAYYARKLTPARLAFRLVVFKGSTRLWYRLKYLGKL